MNTTTSSQPTWSVEHNASTTSVRSLLVRVWRRIQYPAGPESRARLHADRQRPGHGW